MRRTLPLIALLAFIPACTPKTALVHPTWSADGEARQNAFGRRAMGVGDVNGDGYDDLSVGAPDHDQHRGKVYVYCGGPGGLGQRPCWSAEGALRGDQFGDRVGQAGDVNGDGFADLFVAIPSWKGGPGRCEVFLGGKTGLGARAAWGVTPPGGEREQFGDCTHPTGDVNNDGYDDLLVGAYQALSSSGRALLYLGGPRGLATREIWQGRGEAEGDQYGYTLSSVGDINADGFADVIIGAKFHDGSREAGLAAGARSLAGKAYVYYGSAQGLSLPAQTVLGQEANARLSVRSYGIGDVDADGIAEVMISEPGADQGRGAVGIYRGSDLKRMTRLRGKSFGLSEFGQAAGPAGDMNGDGFEDVVIAGRVADRGRALVFFGSAKGIGMTPALSVEEPQQRPGFATWVSPAGDLDGDGLSDLVFGDERCSAVHDLAGRIWVLYGKQGPSKSPRIASASSRLHVYLTKKIR